MREEDVQGAHAGERGIASLAALLTGIGFGVGATTSQVFVSFGFPLLHIAVAQFFCGTVILGMVILVKRYRFPSFKEMVKLFFVGMLQPLATISYYFGIDYLSVGQAVAIQFQYVWLAVVFQHIAQRSFPKRQVVVSTLCIIVGTLLACGIVDDLLGGSGGAPLNALGVLFAIGCAVLYAFYLFFNGRVDPATPPVTRSFIMVVSGWVISSVMSFGFYAQGADYMLAIAPAGLVQGLLMGIIPIVGISIASRKLPSGMVAILGSVELPAAVLSGCLILGDATTPLMVVGVVVILASIVYAQKDEIRLQGEQETPQR